MVLHNRNTHQRALKMPDLLSQRQFHRRELYDVVYRPARVEYLMTGGFEVSPAGDITTLALGRETTIARKTVDKHVERIHRKLGAETRTAAAAIAWAAMRDS
jgi:hypothetical protein